MKIIEIFENNKKEIISEKEGGWWDRNRFIVGKYKKVATDTKIEDRKKAKQTTILFIKETGTDKSVTIQEIVDWLERKKARAHGVVLDKNFINKFLSKNTIGSLSTPTQNKKTPTMPSKSATSEEWKNWIQHLSDNDPELYNKLRKAIARQ